MRKSGQQRGQKSLPKHTAAKIDKQVLDLSCLNPEFSYHDPNVLTFYLLSSGLPPSRLCMRAKLLQSCPTLCNPMHRSLPGSSVHGILQARILECVATPSSRGSSQPRDRTCVSYVSGIGRWVLYHQRPLGSPHHPFSSVAIMICLKCKSNVLIPGFKPFNSFCFLYDKTPWKPKATEPSRKRLFLPLHLRPLLIPHQTSTYLPFSEDVFPLHASKRSQVLLLLYRISFFIHSPSSCPFKLLCILHFSA